MPVLHAFIDESARGRQYYVCAAVVAAGDVSAARQLARSWCAPGQRRWHFTKERDSRRGQILSAIVGSGQVQALVAMGKGDEVLVRRRCLQQLGPDLNQLGTRRLIIESRAHRDAQDRRALHAVLPPTTTLHYEHASPAADPGLWLADAVAWSYSAGGLWRQRLEPILMHVHDVGQV